MDNRFLFRGKRLDNGEWIIGSLCDGDNGHYIVYDNDFYETTKGGQTALRADRYFEICPTTIGQSTGLYAAKSYRGESDEDRLIWEGDVIRWRETNLDDFDYPPQPIRWFGDSQYPAFDMEYHDYDSNGLSHLYVHGYEIEIIGTIYDKEAGQ